MSGQKIYHPTAFIRHVWVGDRMAILDLRSESYFALDPTASFFWELLLLPLTSDERQQKLRSRFNADAIRLETDLNAFTRKCLEDHLLREGPADSDPIVSAPPVVRRPARKLFAVRAWWSLIRVSRSLKASGFATTYQERFPLTGGAEISGKNCDDLARRAVGAFARAENFCYLKKAPKDCLPRSLALFRFLHLVGLQAVHCIGVRQFPFGAHAWVEFQGHVLHDNPAVADIYTVIARLPHEPIQRDA